MKNKGRRTGGLGPAALALLASVVMPAQDPRTQNPFGGSVRQGVATPGEMPLSLEDTIERGLKNNFAAFQDSEERRAAEGARLRVRADLLPNISAGLTETSQQINLKAFGFSSFPGVPTIVGPFGLTDARASLRQAVLNFQSLNESRAESHNVRAANLTYQNTRDVVVLIVGDMYMDAVASASRVELARVQQETDRALYQQAVDYKQNGLVPAIDVLRAKVELEGQQQRVIFYENEFEKKKLALARAIGLPQEQNIRLTDSLPKTPVPPAAIGFLLDLAYKGRSDYLSAMAKVQSAEASRKAALAERYPTVDFNANYGAIGPTLANSHGTYSAAVGLNVPIFQGGRTRGELLEMDAQLEKRKAELEELRGRIEFEIRTALLDIRASARQVEVASDARELAGQQLGQARDRFKAGVADNLEVVQAQQAVAAADENYVSSLLAFSRAKGNVVVGIGGAERLYRDFVLGNSVLPGENQPGENKK